MKKGTKPPKVANYNYADQKEPKHPMGHGDFSNMPDGAMIRPFSKSHNVRSGVINDFACGLEDISHIDENYR